MTAIINSTPAGEACRHNSTRHPTQSTPTAEDDPVSKLSVPATGPCHCGQRDEFIWVRPVPRYTGWAKSRLKLMSHEKQKACF